MKRQEEAKARAETKRKAKEREEEEERFYRRAEETRRRNQEQQRNWQDRPSSGPSRKIYDSDSESEEDWESDDDLRIFCRVHC